MKYERAKIKDPLTGIELIELLDYVDTLEAVAEDAYDLLMDHFQPNDAVTIKLREALNKGK